MCAEHVKSGEKGLSPKLDAVFFGSSPSQVLYNLEVAFALLMPAQNPSSKEAFEFQVNFMKSGGVPLALAMLTRNNFLCNADIFTRRSVTIYTVIIILYSWSAFVQIVEEILLKRHILTLQLCYCYFWGGPVWILTSIFCGVLF